MTRRWPDFVALVLLAAGGVVMEQWGAFAEAREKIERRERVARDAWTSIETAERRRDAIATELAKIERDIRRLEASLPGRLDPDRALAEVRRVAEARDVGVQENLFKEGWDERPLRGELSLVLRGDDRRLEELVAEIPRMTLLSSWKERARWPGERLGTLTFYALPEGGSFASATPARGRRPWLWPFSASVSARERELAALEKRLAARRDDVALVERFDARRGRLRGLLEAIGKLRPAPDEPRAPSP